MTALTVAIQSETMTALPVITTSVATNKSGSVARWFKVDGKLICKWFPVQS